MGKGLLLFNRWPFPPKDGGSFAMKQLAIGLQQEGEDITIFSLNPSRHLISEEEACNTSGKFNYELSPIHTDISWWGALRALIKNESYHASRFFNPEVAKSLTLLLQRQKFDYIVVDGIYMGNYLDTIKKNTNVPLTIRLHNAEHEIWNGLARENRNWLKRCYIKILSEQLHHFEIKTLQKVHKIITLTHDDLQVFAKDISHAQSLVCPVGIDLDFCESYKNKPLLANSFYHIGAMDWQPNIQSIYWFLQQVWKPFVQENQEATFHLAGKSMPEELQTCSIRGYKNYGMVSDPVDFMSQFSVCVVPLFSGSGIRIKILEAMALGKALVATPKAVQGIDIKEGEHYLSANDATSFQKALKRFVYHPDLIVTMGESNSRFARENFDLKTVSKKMIEFVKN